MAQSWFRRVAVVSLCLLMACGSPVLPTTIPSIGPISTLSPAPATSTPSTRPTATRSEAPSDRPSVLPSSTTATRAPAESPRSLLCGSLDVFVPDPGELVVGFSEPAVPPWFVGDPSVAYLGEPVGTTWQVSDPYAGEGFESAIAYAVAGQLGVVRENVRWLDVDRETALAPGSKPFAFYISQAPVLPFASGQISSTRAYYEPNYAMLGLFANPIAEATTLAELRSFTLGAVAGSPSEILIRDFIQPTTAPSSFADLESARSALERDDIDGLAVDLPTAFRLRDEEIPGSVVVGQFDATDMDLGIIRSMPTGYAIALPQNGQLSECISFLVGTLYQNGTIDALRRTWLVDRANAPILE